jgi:hypothetical protein
MNTLRVTDNSGDTSYTFDPAEPDSPAVKEAMEVFNELVGGGTHFAAVRDAPGGKASLGKTFDPNAQETVLWRKSAGG